MTTTKKSDIKEKKAKKNALPNRCAVCWGTEKLQPYKEKHICFECVDTLKSQQQ